MRKVKKISPSLACLPRSALFNVVSSTFLHFNGIMAEQLIPTQYFNMYASMYSNHGGSRSVDALFVLKSPL